MSHSPLMRESKNASCGSNRSLSSWATVFNNLGTPLGGTFGSATAALSGNLDTTPFLTGTRTLWVRAQDAAGNWGPAAALGVVVNGPDLSFES